ncbi:DUF1589 domain-containing protein [Rhodopirellula islandica]|uniref:DUF1589 domain-containing protein n=1 Tax=Rhodopirellula islandica TaxID=595434 RepID=UPI0036F2FDB8
MLWNKARRQRTAVARPTCTGQEPSPGGTWPTAATSIRSRIRQNSVHARRPCLTWRPRRCFGTKRGVNELPSRDQHAPAKNHRQVEPGRQQPRQFVAGFARIRLASVGHVPHGSHADALEQSEASSNCRRETNAHRPRTIARWNLAYSSHINS